PRRRRRDRRAGASRGLATGVESAKAAAVAAVLRPHEPAVRKRETDRRRPRLRKHADAAVGGRDAEERAIDLIDDELVARREQRQSATGDEGGAELRPVRRGEPRDPVVGAALRQDR